MSLNKLVTSVSLLVSVCFSPAYAARVKKDFNDIFEKQMTNNHAKVSRSKTWITTNCKVTPIKECDNFANPSLTYQMPLIPCSPEEGCTQANDKILPFSKSSAAWHLDNDEAIVLIANKVAPSNVYWSFELEIYERYLTNIPELWNYKEPKSGEILPDPIAHRRFVVSAAVGESANQLNTSFGSIPFNNGEKGYIQIYSANKNVSNKIIKNLVDLGYPREFINVYGLPKAYVNENTDYADTYRIIGRIGHSTSSADVGKWVLNNPIGIFRVTFNDKDEKPIGYDLPKETNPITGKNERQGFDVEWNKFKKIINNKFGEASETIIPKGRSYNSHFCANTGSYCWGYNRDALYLDINDPQTNESAKFDLSKSENSRVVIVGVDHQKTGFTTFWNFGIFSQKGEIRSHFDFEDIQQNKWNAKLGSKFDDKLFWVQIKKKCYKIDQNCIEAKLKKSDNSIFQLVNRNYLSSITSTAPSIEEFALPEIYYYE